MFLLSRFLLIASFTLQNLFHRRLIIGHCFEYLVIRVLIGAFAVSQLYSWELWLRLRVDWDIFRHRALLLLRNKGPLVASGHWNTVPAVCLCVRWLWVNGDQTHSFWRLLLWHLWNAFLLLVSTRLLQMSVSRSCLFNLLSDGSDLLKSPLHSFWSFILLSYTLSLKLLILLASLELDNCLWFSSQWFFFERKVLWWRRKNLDWFNELYWLFFLIDLLDELVCFS